MLPDWASKYKEKGTIIRKAKSKNTLKYLKYRVHSERIKGKKYPVLIQDEFLGTITLEDGFIPANKRLIDFSDLEVLSLYDFKDKDIFLNDYDSEEIEVLKSIYVLKYDNHYYFPKLNDRQKILLDKHGVNYAGSRIFN